jgi:hypothetical protein
VQIENSAFCAVILGQCTAKYLFVPLAEAVVFAMLASYLLSRTVVPTFAKYLLPPEMDHHRSHEPAKPKTIFGKISLAFESGFSRFREGYRDLLSICLRHPKVTVFTVLGFAAVSMLLFPFLGEDFFPAVDAGSFDMHVRMKPGTRIEETARTADAIEQMLRRIIPASQLKGIVDNLGIPYSGINLSYNTTGTTSAADGDILVGSRLLDYSHLSASGRELPILDRAFHCHYGITLRADRDCLDVIRHRHHTQCSRLNGNHYVHGGGHLEQRSGDYLCQ